MKEGGGIEDRMDIQSHGQPARPQERHTGWLEWAEQHPGFVLLGALVVAILAFRRPSRAIDVQPETTGEEVPLFI
jgi:hypothetical protein